MVSTTNWWALAPTVADIWKSGLTGLSVDRFTSLLSALDLQVPTQEQLDAFVTILSHEGIHTVSDLLMSPKLAQLVQTFRDVIPASRDSSTPESGEVEVVPVTCPHCGGGIKIEVPSWQ